MTPEEYKAATSEQPDEYPDKLSWVMDKASCKAAVLLLSKEFWDNPSSFNWVELEQAMARYQNVSLNCKTLWKI
jgi:hypothetical protein